MDQNVLVIDDILDKIFNVRLFIKNATGIRSRMYRTTSYDEITHKIKLKIANSKSDLIRYFVKNIQTAPHVRFRLEFREN